MARSTQVYGPGSDGVAVADDAVSATGWHELDLGRTFRRLVAGPARRDVLATDEASWSVSTALVTTPEWGTIPAVAPGLSAVPASALVVVSRKVRPGKRGSVPEVRSSREANDNMSGEGRRSVWRDMFFLAILAATVLGAFWSGRVQGYQKVIVVPGPSSFYSVVT